jgi:hypothetical protein
MMEQYTDHGEKMSEIGKKLKHGELSTVDSRFVNGFLKRMYDNADKFAAHCDRLRFGAARIKFHEKGSLEQMVAEERGGVE